ncbi:MAG: hypothetical protein LAT77_11325 [Aliidiomarina sp.]|uniref:hypothetical protein n=1 Tax=Aliidiomarina sp. TaxID=1872439 RepID=UPI0025C51D5C|nr:hypothetical protein [Aliidiomarina sp.]MCH8502487.1 hypothetical protein [Aliidiomarina sp.]
MPAPKFKSSANDSRISIGWPLLGAALGTAAFAAWWGGYSEAESLASPPTELTIAAIKQAPLALPVDAGCDVLLNVYGRLSDLQRSQEWLEQTQSLYQSQHDTIQFCGRLITSVWQDECESNQGRSSCQLADPSAYDLVWQQPPWNAAQQVDVVLTDDGIANTRNGLVFVDRNARPRVLAHELGHTLGIADEYAMSEDLASRFCAGEFNFSALNLVITESTIVDSKTLVELTQSLPWQHRLQQPIAEKLADDRWRLGSRDPLQIGLHPVATCEGTDFYAWRPVGYVTLWQQHEIGVLPDVYLYLMRQRLDRQ